MIDLHSHVLPGIDDGPRDLQGSVAMARVAAAAGTTRLVATPHLREDFPKVQVQELAGRVAGLNRALEAAGAGVRVLPGAEVDLGAATERSDAELRLATLGGNGRDLLVETPYGGLPSVFEALLDSIRERGFRVTLAHPELNRTFQADPERLGRLAASGVLLQLTARSLLAGRRSGSRGLARTALERGWAHVLASDAHSADWRPPRLGPDVREIGRQEPHLEARLHWMTESAPGALLAGASLPPAPAVGARPRRSLAAWLGARGR